MTTVGGAVIAGGRSGRLGTDKRFVEVDGVPLLARTVTLLRPLVDDVQIVVADAADLSAITASLAAVIGPDAVDAVRFAVDARADVGPAAGLEAALAGARCDVVLVVATDHPALAPGVLQLLCERAIATGAQAVAVAGPRGLEPFLAAYRRDALPTVTGALDAGTRRMQDVLAALDPIIVDEAEWRALDPAGRTLADVDVPSDLERFR